MPRHFTRLRSRIRKKTGGRAGGRKCGGEGRRGLRNQASKQSSPTSCHRRREGTVAQDVNSKGKLPEERGEVPKVASKIKSRGTSDPCIDHLISRSLFSFVFFFRRVRAPPLHTPSLPPTFLSLVPHFPPSNIPEPPLPASIFLFVSLPFSNLPHHILLTPCCKTESYVGTM